MPTGHYLANYGTFAIMFSEVLFYFKCSIFRCLNDGINQFITDKDFSKLVGMTLNSDQQRVYEWLNIDLGLSVFAEAYRGAAIFVIEKPAGYISFVSHVGRDLMNGLASTVSGVKSGRVQYERHIDQLQDHWLVHWQLTDDLSPEVMEAGHFIPAPVCQRISSLIEEHKAGRERSEDKVSLFFSTFLDYSDMGKIPENFRSEWKATKEWFLSHAHLRKKPFDADIDIDMVKHFNCLDSYLHIAASSQYERLRALNEILDITNQ